MQILQKSSKKVVDFVTSLEENKLLSQQQLSNSNDNIHSTTSSTTNSNINGDFTFIYEEDIHPEVFFVPYIWEVVVKVVTHNFLEWNLDNISLFLDDNKDDSSSSTTTTTTNIIGKENESSALLKNVDDI